MFSIRSIINILTWSRIAVVPVILYLLFWTTCQLHPVVKMTIIILVYTYGALTDFWDGKLARKYKLTSRFGAFLDPLADKLFTLSIFTSFLFLQQIYIAWWIVVLILIREIGITIIRIWAISKNAEMRTEVHGKIKTIMQITAQGVVWAVLLFYSILFETSVYKDFAESYNGNALSRIAIKLFADSEVLFYPWVYSILDALPMIFVGAAGVMTVYSGITYFYGNKEILLNK
jgi:CDP-diacylglycerol--glycerol-3-phosphate 3-phosphatidyltransferase